MYRMCKEFRVLPGPGGLLDQDYYHVILLQHVMAAVEELQDKQLKDAEKKAKQKR